jgi:DNA-binding transcriptional LysR family regulator
MHIKSLKLFCDIVALRSFSRAARENGLTQSGASQVVHQLEEHLDVKLLDRSKRPFVLTPEGEAYYDGCRRLVRQYLALEEQVRTRHNEVAGRVNVASIYSVGLTHMNRYVLEFLAEHSRADIRVEYQHPDRVYELVETDLADFGLVSYPRESRSIKATLWREEPMVVVCAPGHALAGRVSLSLSELAGQRMVGFVRDLGIRREIDRALATCDVEVDTAMEFDNIETIKRAVQIDAGVSLLPAPSVDREVRDGSLVAVPLSGEPLVRPVGIIQRQGRELGDTARRFLSFLLDRAETSSRGAAPGASNGADAGANGRPAAAARRRAAPRRKGVTA